MCPGTKGMPQNIPPFYVPEQLSRGYNGPAPLTGKQVPIIYFDVTGQGPAEIIKGKGLNANETLVTILAPKCSVSKTFTSNINEKGINYKSIGHSEDLFKCLVSQKEGKLNPDKCVVESEDRIEGQQPMQTTYPNDYEGPTTIFIYERRPGDSVMVQGILQSVKSSETAYTITFACFEKAELLPENEPHDKPSHKHPHVHATAQPGRTKQGRGSQLQSRESSSTWSLQIYEPAQCYHTDCYE